VILALSTDVLETHAWFRGKWDSRGPPGRGSVVDDFSNLKGSRATALERKEALASVLSAAVRFELLASNPLKEVALLPDKVGRKKKPIITKEQFLRLVDAMEEPHATMVFTCVMAQRRAADDLIADLERRREVAVSSKKPAVNEVQSERELERNRVIDLGAVS
jgi:hypothetical protein